MHPQIKNLILIEPKHKNLIFNLDLINYNYFQCENNFTYNIASSHEKKDLY